MTKLQFLELGKRLALMVETDQTPRIQWGKLPDDMDADAILDTRNGRIVFMVKPSAIPLKVENVNDFIAMFRKLLFYGRGTTTEEIVFASWPASAAIAALPLREQRRILSEGVDVLRIAKDGTESVERKDVRLLTEAETEQCFDYSFSP